MAVSANRRTSDSGTRGVAGGGVTGATDSRAADADTPSGIGSAAASQFAGRGSERMLDGVSAAGAVGGEGQAILVSPTLSRNATPLATPVTSANAAAAA